MSSCEGGLPAAITGLGQPESSVAQGDPFHLSHGLQFTPRTYIDRIGIARCGPFFVAK